jgi:hypothetical protein
MPRDLMTPYASSAKNMKEKINLHSGGIKKLKAVLKPSMGNKMIGRKIVLIWFCVMMALVAIVGTVIIKNNISGKELKAVQIAQEYLSKKYEQEMRCEGVRFSWIDPGLYHIYFFSMQSEIYFEVFMWPITLNASDVYIKDNRCIWDDYIEQFLCRGLEKALLPEVGRIWGDGATIHVQTDNSNVYPGKGDFKFSEQMTAVEIEPYFNIEFNIATHRILTIDSKAKEAALIFAMIQSIKLSEYQPRAITFRYIAEKNEDSEKNIFFGEGYDPFNYGRLGNWHEVNNVEQVIKVINDQLFAE